MCILLYQAVPNQSGLLTLGQQPRGLRRWVDEQSRLIESDQISSAVVVSQVRSEWTDQDISNIMTSEDSNALVGLLS